MKSCRNGAGIKRSFWTFFIILLNKDFLYMVSKKSLEFGDFFQHYFFFIFLIDCFVEPIFKGIIMELTHGYKKKTFSSILFAKKCKLHFTASLIKYSKHNNLPFFISSLQHRKSSWCYYFFYSDKINLLQSY